MIYVSGEEKPREVIERSINTFSIFIDKYDEVIIIKILSNSKFNY